MAADSTTDSQARLYTSDERMTLQVGSTEFACVEYPGIVENVENALLTLGGIKSVSKVSLHLTVECTLRPRLFALVGILVLASLAHIMEYGFLRKALEFDGCGDSCGYIISSSPSES